MSLFQYSWFAAIIVGVLFSTLFYRVSDATLAHKGLVREEVNRAYLCISGAMAITAGIIGTVQAIANIQNPFFLYSQNLDNPYVLVAKLTLTAFWITFALWVWFSKQFNTYSRLVLPQSLYFFLKPSRAILSVIIIIGIAAIYLYPGNRLPFVVINLSHSPINWIEVSSGDSRGEIKSIKARSQKVKQITLGSNERYTLRYKLDDNPKIYGAKIPFAIGEFSVGMVQVVMDSSGQLKIIDRRLFK